MERSEAPAWKRSFNAKHQEDQVQHASEAMDCLHFPEHKTGQHLSQQRARVLDMIDHTKAESSKGYDKMQVERVPPLAGGHGLSRLREFVKDSEIRVQLMNILRQYDDDDCKRIGVSGFKVLVSHMFQEERGKHKEGEGDFVAFFAEFDQDGTGSITHNALCRLLNCALPLPTDSPVAEPGSLHSSPGGCLEIIDL